MPLWDSKKELGVCPGWYDNVAKTMDGQMDYERIPNSGGLCLMVGGKGVPYLSHPLDAFQMPRLTLLKTDVQQADLRVLVGARETIKRTRPVICFEYECTPGASRNFSGDALEDSYEFFRGLNYDVTQLCKRDCGGDFVAVPR